MREINRQCPLCQSKNTKTPNLHPSTHPRRLNVTEFGQVVYLDTKFIVYTQIYI